MFLEKLRHGCYQGCLVPYKTTNQGYLLLISSFKKRIVCYEPDLPIIRLWFSKG